MIHLKNIDLFLAYLHVILQSYQLKLISYTAIF